MKARVLATTVLLTFASASSAFEYKTNATSCESSKNVKGLPVAVLCDGYSDDKQMPEPVSCLAAGSISYAPGGKSVVELGKAYSFDEIQKYLNVNISAKGTIDVFSGSANADYAQYIDNTDYSESFNYLEQIILPTEIFTPAGFGTDTLNDYGQKIYQTSPDVFRSYCGNKLYQQQTLGADLFASFNIHFNSAYEKDTFDSHVGAGVGDFISAAASIQSIVQQYNIHGTLEVSAMQDGGDPTQIAKIFGKCGDNYCVASCDLDKLSDCQGIINGIVDYAQNNLPAQVDFKNERVIGNAVPINFSYMDYQSLGLTVGNPVVTPGNPIWNARQNLWQIYEDTQTNLTLVSHVLSSYVAPYIGADYIAKLKALSQALQSNIHLLEDPTYGAIACYFYPGNCVETANQITAELQPIDQDTLALFSKAYAAQNSHLYLIIPLGGSQYWDGGDGEHLAARLTLTLSPDGNTMSIDGTDIYNYRAYGTFNKVNDDTYTGIFYSSNPHQAPEQTTITLINNPV